MKWEKLNDVCIQSGNYLIAKFDVDGTDKYLATFGRHSIGYFDTPDAARAAVKQHDDAELAGTV